MHLVDAEDLADGVRRVQRYWEGGTDRDDSLSEVLQEPAVPVERRVRAPGPGEP